MTHLVGEHESRVVVVLVGVDEERSAEVDTSKLCVP